MGDHSMKRDLNTYMRLFFIIDKLFARYDPCQNCTGCGGSPFSPRVPFDCCEGCPFNSPTGCTTYSIACKLWLCEQREQRKLSNLFRHQRRRLKRIAVALNFHYARAHPMEVLLLSDKLD